MYGLTPKCVRFPGGYRNARDGSSHCQETEDFTPNMSSEGNVLELLQRQNDALKLSRQEQLQLNAQKAASEAALSDAAIKCAQGLVKLNVGGVRYTTSLTTLTAVPDSFFASLFSGEWQSTKTADGDVFVDRDGEVSSVYDGVALSQQFYNGQEPSSVPAVREPVATLLQVFKHVLQYLRAVRDQQPFACAESFTRDQLAAIAAEAHFTDLQTWKEPLLSVTPKQSMSTSTCL